MKKVLSVFNYLVFLLLGMLFLWLVFRNLNGKEILDEILHANYYWIVLCMLAGLLSHLVRAARWNLLINSMGHTTRLSTTFYAVMTGYLANTAVPRLGEVTRCGVLSKKSSIPFRELLGTVIAERIFDMIIMLLIILGVIMFQLGLVGTFVDKYVFSPLFSHFENNFIPILIILLIVAAIFLILVVIWKRHNHRLHRYAFYQKIMQFGKGLVDGIKTIKRTEKKGLFMLYTALIWGLYTLMIYLPFHSLEATSSLNFGDALTVMSIGSLGIVAPVPGGIGTYHFIVKAILFELYGVPQASAASFATITHAAQTLMIIVVGGFSFLMLFLQKNTNTYESS
ncbi:MAG TPA: lysylphosphatidylglycerol synthase transmembrane domain-containing protein [Bacteroidales bacterium]|nr:lysylphosphatidylglycerol synthase transmembrane domain-containing protein [Bacteroidales bacterium]